MRLDTKLKKKYEDRPADVQEYMAGLVDQLVFDYGEVNPSWELSLDMICDWYTVYVGARDDIKENGISFTDAAGGLHKNPSLGVMNTATLHIQSILRSFAASPYQKSKMKSLNKDIKDDSRYLEGIFNN